MTVNLSKYKKLNIAMNTIGEDGLTPSKRSGLKQKGEKSVFYNFIWINNSIIELRHNPDEIIPSGFLKGRLKTNLKGIPRKEKICPYCNKIGRGGNMVRYHFDNCKKKVSIDEN